MSRFLLILPVFAVDSLPAAQQALLERVVAASREKVKEWTRPTVQRVADMRYVGDKLVFKSSTTKLRLGTFYLIARDVDHNTPGEVTSFCFARNSRYYFSLKKDSTSAKWTVVDTVVPASELSASTERIWLKPYRDEILSPLKEITREHIPFVNFHSLGMLELLPALKVTAVSASDDGMIQVCYTFSHDAVYFRRMALPASAVIYAAPSSGYNTSRFEMRCKGNDLEIERTAIIDYTKVEGRHIARRTEWQETKTFQGKTWTERNISELLEISWQDPPESAFTLSAFGLPEPFGVEWERPTPWWLYAGIAAGTLVLLISLLGIWKRRLLARS
jgi:hypothetical protein